MGTKIIKIKRFPIKNVRIIWLDIQKGENRK